MAWDTMHSWWTFGGLVGAFLDLAIVYFLLCASTFAYFASKFLGIFGLSLPCTCTGLFGSPNSNFCAQRLLVEYSTKQVSDVHFSVKNKFPFDSISSKSQDCHLNTKSIREGENNANGCTEIIGESSCGSASDARKSRNVVGKESSPRNRTEFGAMKQGVKEGKCTLKGKHIINLRTKGGIRRRKKYVRDYGKYSSVSSYDLPCVDLQGFPQSPASINMEENDRTESSSFPFYSEIDTCCFKYDGELTTVMGSGDRASHSLELNEKNAVRVLEQALEEEQSARAALYLELEKERNAAATAADEAMAMILRLQEEKASVEMEARQFERVVEEKYAYDAEEMNILKEILVRREREKLFLEKEVEAYRQMIYPESVGNDMQDMDIQKLQVTSSLLDLSGDPDLVLQQLGQSIDKKEVVIIKSSDDLISIDKQSSIPDLNKELPIQGWEEGNDFIKQDLDKHVVHLPEKTIPLVGQEQEQEQNTNSTLAQAATMKMTGTEISSLHRGENFKEHGEDECHGNIEFSESVFDKEPCVQDVHVIDDVSSLSKKANGNRSMQLLNIDASRGHKNNDLSSSVGQAQGIHMIKDSPATSFLNTEPGLKRSTSDMVSGLPPMDLRARSKPSDWRRNSLPIVDKERLRLDDEVGWLREKLKKVQEGRQMLNLSMGHREREKMQFQLLDDILYSLWEIQQLTEHGKSERQTSLPPPSSEFLGKRELRSPLTPSKLTRKGMIRSSEILCFCWVREVIVVRD